MEAPFLDLLNSDWQSGHGPGGTPDHLDDPGWWDAFVRRWGGPHGGPHGAEVEAWRALRRDLRAAVDHLTADEGLPGALLARLNRRLARVSHVPRLERTAFGYTLAEERRGDPSALALSDLTAAFVRVLADGDGRRLRLCANPDCRWAFFDESKNRSRRWCEPATCGNLMKVRRFRDRRRVAAGDPRAHRT